MDNRLKEIVENFENMKIGLDEPFKFNCTQCGKCCINREDILLTPKDLYNIAKELGLTPVEAFKQYCETYVGHDSRMPIVRLLPRGSIKRCPLLKDRKCSVHKVKPTVCAMFPIGRCITLDGNKPELDKLGTADIQYIFTRPGCGDDSQTHTVREWLSEFDISAEDEFFVKWHTAIMEIGSIVKHAEKEFSDSTMETMWSTIFAAMYINYDTDKDFISQFDANYEGFMKVLGLIPIRNGGKNHA